MDLNDTGNRWIAGIIVVLLIIGAWYLGVMHASQSQMSMTASSEQSASSTGMQTATTSISSSAASMGDDNTAVAADDSVQVANQPAGMSVMVQSVTLSQPGWVAIRDSNGRTLGAGLFPAGTTNNGTVPLLRGTTAGQQYQVLLYDDNGDHQFDLHTDSIVMNSSGAVVGTNFTAQ